ncbi:MAG: MFS transporter [Sphingomonadaceae bacterium]|nr:MFS transporter [Sphingomonadaceae bacterium]
MNEDGDTAGREAAFAAAVEQHLRRNMVANFTHGMLGMTGFRVIYAPTLLPAWLLLISDSHFVVGLGQALLQLGILVTPLISAAALEHRHQILPAALRYGTIMRLAVLGLALSAWFTGGWLCVVLAMGFLLLLGLSNGMQRVAFQMLIGKLIPIDRRGRLQGWRNLLGGGIAAILSYAAGRWLIGENILGNGFATTFALAFVLTSMGLVALKWGVVEPASPVVRPRSDIASRVRDIPLLLTDPSYRHFVWAQAFAMAGRIAAPFYILIAAQNMGLDGQTIGILSLAYLGADTLSNPLWGYVGDRYGYKLTSIVALVLMLGGLAALQSHGSSGAMVAAFAAFGASSAGYSMSTQTMVLEFGAREDVPMRIALSTMVEGGLSGTAPILGGLILGWAGAGAMLACAALLTAIALWVMAFRVTDPRKAVAPPYLD